MQEIEPLILPTISLYYLRLAKRLIIIGYMMGIYYGCPMCGRFSYFIGSDVLKEYFGISKLSHNIEPRYNIAPNDEVYVVVSENQNQLKLMKWGLLPHWSPEKTSSKKMINARSETIWQKGAFKHSIAKKRCVIPASGFYEWKEDKGKKIPYFFYLEDQDVMPLGGIYDTWYSDFGYTITSFSIITTEANSVVENIHNRMPLILNQKNIEKWLDPTINEKMTNALMKPYEGHLSQYTVSSYVNSPKNKSEECISKYEYKDEFESLDDYF
ncbi:MAG: SOS response-associated peptidase [Candidatus Heimdallarchaeota archaeon]|nr:SOS response-associated peptidase [Candidatus Heimdallarchaeota archaeon]